MTIHKSLCSPIREFLDSSSLDEAAIRREAVEKALEAARQQSASALRQLLIPFQFLMAEYDDQLQDGIIEHMTEIERYTLLEMQLLLEESQRITLDNERRERHMNQVEMFFKHQDVMLGFLPYSIQSVPSDAFDELEKALLLKGSPEYAALTTDGFHRRGDYERLFGNTRAHAVDPEALDRMSFESPDLVMKLDLLLQG